MIKDNGIFALKKNAVTAFNENLNCAQSILAAFSNTLDMDRSPAISLATGFGAGMGRLQKTCGAVTGSFMAISHHCSIISEDNADAKEKAISMIRQFHDSFIAKHGTTDCSELLKLDLNTAEGLGKYQETGLRQKVCENCIADSVEILCRILR